MPTGQRAVYKHARIHLNAQPSGYGHNNATIPHAHRYRHARANGHALRGLAYACA